jgi:hypothetical protein
MLTLCHHGRFGLPWIPAFAGMTLIVPGLLLLLPALIPPKAGSKRTWMPPRPPVRLPNRDRETQGSAMVFSQSPPSMCLRGQQLKREIHAQIYSRIFWPSPCRRGLRFGYSPCLRHPGPCPGSPGRCQRRRNGERTLHDLAAPLPRPSSRSRLGVPALHDPARLQVKAYAGLPRESTLVCGAFAVRTPHFLSLPRFGPTCASLARAGAGGPFALPGGTGA